MTTSSDVNPRSGGAGFSVSGAFDFNDAWSVFGFAGWLHDMPTRTETTASNGGDIFRFSVGAQWLPHPQWMVMLALSGSPPSQQTNSTTRRVLDRDVEVIIDSNSNSFGAQAFAGWMNEWSMIDVGAGLNRFDIFQQLRLGDGPGAELVRRVCERRNSEVCSLVDGASTPLWQGRFSASYTATLFRHTDVGGEVGVFVYDRDPADVGYFSVVQAGRSDLGSGVPVLPLSFTLRPSVSHRFSSITLRLSYQYGLYASWLGAMHATTVKTTLKLGAGWRLSLSVTGQLDVDLSPSVVSYGGAAVLGVLRVF
ncbi:MAG: hypothetical protein ACO1OB_34480 [Archangium sp.]